MLLIPTRPDTKGADKTLGTWKAGAEQKYAPRLVVDVDTGPATSKLDKFAGKAGAIAAGMNVALGAGKELLSAYPDLFGDINEETAKTVSALTDGAQQMASWATTGAALGSVVPGIGTALGAAAGAVASAAVSTYAWFKNTEDVKEETAKILALEKQRKEEAKEVETVWKRVVEVSAFAGDGTARDGSRSGGISARELQDAKEQLKALNEELQETARITPVDILSGLETDDSYKVYLAQQAELGRQAQEAFEDAKERERQEGFQRDKEEFERHWKEQGALADELYNEWLDKQKKAQEDQERETKESHDRLLANYKDYFSKVGDFLGGFTAQLEDNIAAGNKALSGMGLAAQKGVAGILKALGNSWKIKAIGELAEGFAQAASLNVPGALAHFGAAAKYGAAAAAAGVAGAVTAGNASARESAQDAPSSSTSTGGSIGGGSGSVRDPGPTQHSTIIVYYGGGPGSTNLYTASGEDAKASAGMIVKDWMVASEQAGPILTDRG